VFAQGLRQLSVVRVEKAGFVFRYVVQPCSVGGLQAPPSPRDASDSTPSTGTCLCHRAAWIDQFTTTQNVNLMIVLQSTVTNDWHTTPATQRHKGQAHERLFKVRKLPSERNLQASTPLSQNEEVASAISPHQLGYKPTYAAREVFTSVACMQPASGADLQSDQAPSLPAACSHWTPPLAFFQLCLGWPTLPPRTVVLLQMIHVLQARGRKSSRSS